MNNNVFLDGSIISDWIYDSSISLTGNKFYLSDYIDSDGIKTSEIQKIIDDISLVGGWLVVDGIYKTGALFFKNGVNLYIEKDCKLIGSDDINDYPLVDTRIEGESCLYYSALINASGVDGFTIAGEGTIDGNGLKSWMSFWKRLKWNPKCTNKDEQRARLIYISNSKNVTISGVSLINSQFWTNHIYKCSYVRFINCKIYSPTEGVKAPSTDAIDIDVCKYVLVKNCDISVNDDAVVLKGGKGPYADLDCNNGSNEFVIIEDCHFGVCHSCLTCGSESIHNKNIIMRRCMVNNARNMLWLKMRTDTPQNYEYISLYDISGNATNGIFVKPWTQFYDLKDRVDIPMSYAKNIYFNNINLSCDRFFNITLKDEEFRLSKFYFNDCFIQCRVSGFVDIENSIFNVLIKE